ncbi:MAG: hypothetical protein V2A76_13635 [Planctomycetota bacterium]
MISVRSLERGLAPDLPSMVIAEIEMIDHGLTVIASSVPLGEEAQVEVLAKGVDGQIVLVMVEDGPAEPLFLRATQAVLEYRRTAGLLARLQPSGRFDSRETPRFILVSRRFPEGLQERLALLRIPGLQLVECAVAEGVGGFRLLVTGRVNVGQAGVRQELLPRIGVGQPGGSGEEAAAERSTRDPELSDRAGSNGNGRAEKAATSEVVPPRYSLVDIMKQRLLRLSPEVVQEEDGDLVSFRISGHLLATVRSAGDQLLVAAGEEGSDPISVVDDDGVNIAMDAVFERFFGMSPTRRRIAAADRRASGLGRARRLASVEEHAAPLES